MTAFVRLRHTITASVIATAGALISNSSFASDTISRICTSKAPLSGQNKKVDSTQLLIELYSTNLIPDAARNFDQRGTVSNDDLLLVAAAYDYCLGTSICRDQSDAVEALHREIIDIFGAEEPKDWEKFKRSNSAISIPEIKNDLITRYRANMPDDPQFNEDSIGALIEGSNLTDAQRDSLLLGYAYLAGLPIGDLNCAVPDDSKETGPATASAETETETETDYSVTSKFKLRQTIGDLAKPFKSASAASFSMTEDFENRGDVLEADFVTGVTFNIIPSDLSDPSFVSYTNLTPFIGWKRYETTNNADDVNNISMGGQFENHARWTSVSFTTSTALKVVTDEEADTEIGALDLEVSPNFAAGEYGLDFFSRDHPLGAFALRPRISLLGQVGFVGDDGGNTQIEEDSGFARGGAVFEVVLTPNQGPLLELFELRSRIQYLHGFEGKPNSAYNWDTGLTYLISKDPQFGVTLSYVQGQANDTFEDLERAKLGFTLKF